MGKNSIRSTLQMKGVFPTSTSTFIILMIITAGGTRHLYYWEVMCSHPVRKSEIYQWNKRHYRHVLAIQIDYSDPRHAADDGTGLGEMRAVCLCKGSTSNPLIRVLIPESCQARECLAAGSLSGSSELDQTRSIL